MENNSNEFLKQFGGSATANVLTVIVFMVFKFIEGRCKHSKCSSNTSCFSCSADNYATERGGSSVPRVKENDVRPTVSMQEVHPSNDKEVQEGHSAVIQVNQPPSSETSGDGQLARGDELV